MNQWIPTCLLITTALASAQHDPQRNATQAIAAGDFAKAERILSAAEAADPETLFVRMMLELARGQVGEAQATAREALDTGLPLPRLAAGPRELLGTLQESDAYGQWVAEYGEDRLKLLHGPMVGAVTDSSASFWVRTGDRCQVQIRIGDKLSVAATSTPESDFTAVVRVDGLRPSTVYEYRVILDGEPVDMDAPKFSTFPKRGRPGKFSVAFGGGAGFVPEWEYMWDTIRKSEPAALLMMGDNVYIDQPQFSLCQHYCYQRRQERSEWRRLVAGTPTYSIYDDHDFGTNDCVPARSEFRSGSYPCGGSSSRIG